MQLSKKLLVSGYRFPTLMVAPTNYTTEQVAFVENAASTTYSVPADGFYLVEVRGAGGGSHSQAGGGGGYREQLVYLYQGQKCVLWGANAPAGYNTGFNSYTGYPGTQGNLFGGRGATGYTGDESGGAGGGAAENAGTARGYEGGWGGGGSGFIAGFDDIAVAEHSLTAGSMTVSINRQLALTPLTFVSITTYVMAGGAGGGCGTDGGNRAGGGGGGAFGNGGNTYGGSGEAGPAGTWGKGGDSGRYGSGANGAWAVIDFSTNTVLSGLGGGGTSTNGFCRLSKVIPA